MTHALRWAAMRAILMFHNCEGQSHKTVSTDHNFWRGRRAEADLNGGPSAYQLNALPLGLTMIQVPDIYAYIGTRYLLSWYRYPIFTVMMQVPDGWCRYLILTCVVTCLYRYPILYTCTQNLLSWYRYLLLTAICQHRYLILDTSTRY